MFPIEKNFAKQTNEEILVYSSKEKVRSLKVFDRVGSFLILDKGH